MICILFMFFFSFVNSFLNNKIIFSNSFFRTFSNKKIYNSNNLYEKTINYTKNQQLYVDALNDPNVILIFVIGSAGTGKTFISCKWGLNQFLIGNMKKIIITRPLISVSNENIGFIPGDITDKMQPWAQPIYDAFLDNNIINKISLNKYILNSNIEIVPLGFMRGRTFSNSFIFADEMQNSTPEQMLMLLTRIGNNSKVVISGDLQQSDIDKNNNGLFDFINKFKSFNPSNSSFNNTQNNFIKVIKFDKEDIFRSKITSIILDIYK